eukprot:7391564-Prymnesium_polylepis.3
MASSSSSSAESPTRVEACDGARTRRSGQCRHGRMHRSGHSGTAGAQGQRLHQTALDWDSHRAAV